MDRVYIEYLSVSRFLSSLWNDVWGSRGGVINIMEGLVSGPEYFISNWIIFKIWPNNVLESSKWNEIKIKHYLVREVFSFSKREMKNEKCWLCYIRYKYQSTFAFCLRMHLFAPSFHLIHQTSKHVATTQ